MPTLSNITTKLSVLIYIFVSLFSHLINSGHYVGIEGNSISLKCNTSQWDDNMIALILWYKGSDEIPIFSIDSRETNLLFAKHTTSSERYSSHSDEHRSSSQLTINKLYESDEGEYRCRVDYKNDRTQHYTTKLTVIGEFQ